jgi:hypothetical protein
MCRSDSDKELAQGEHMLTLMLHYATHHTLTAGLINLISTGDMWIQTKSWCKALTDKNKDSVDINDTASGGDVKQYLSIGIAAHHIQGIGPFPYR